MLGQRLRRFRFEEVFSKVSNRSLRMQSPSFQALNTVSISSNLFQCQSYSTTPYLASSRLRAAPRMARENNNHNEESTNKVSNESSAANALGFTPTADGTELVKYYGDYFYNPSNQNAYDVRTGAYVDVDEKDILRYFPEGLAGETDEEFQFTNKKRWMIRDSTKVLFRIIEETEKRLNYDGNAAMGSTIVNKPKENDVLSNDNNNNNNNNNNKSTPKLDGVGLHSAVQIPRLQGQSEWPESQLRVSYFGKDLFPTTGDVASTEFEGFVKTKGPGSTLEQTMDALKNAIKEDKKKNIPDRIVLSGGRGHGKSTVLNQAVMFARQRGWLVVFVPNGWEHVHSGPYIQPLTVKNNQNGEDIVYDNPYMNKVLLRGLWKAHHKQLKKLVIENQELLVKYQPLIMNMKKAISQAITLPGRDKLSFVELRAIVTEEEDHLEEYDTLDADVLKGYDFLKSKLITLEDLILLGVSFADISGFVVQDIISELRQQTQIPVLFAVDQYNTWFAPSAFSYETAGKLTGKQLNVPNALTFLDTKKHGTAQSHWQVKHGLCIAATSMNHTEVTKKVDILHFDTDITQSLPLKIRVNAYTHQEYIAAMSYYLQPGISPLGAVLQWDDIFMFRMMTNAIPRLLRRESLPYFLPKNVRGLEQELEMAALLGMSDASKTHKAEDFDISLGFDDDDENNTGDFASFVSEQGGKMDDRFFAPDGSDATEKEEFFDISERTDADDFYSDVNAEDGEDDDLGPRRTKK